VTALETEGVARLYGIHFEVDSDVPKPSATAALERLLAALRAAPDLVVDIEGHTDSDGEDAYNLDLSNRRAQSVVNWLVAQGIDATRLGPVGKGEAEPVASNDTADGKALNRRVDIRRR
jgi:OOP family OmpA-OmpF porin